MKREEREKNLQRIQPPDKNHTPEQVARQIVQLYRKDFNITIAGACNLFSCERQWVEDFIIPNVKHLFVTHFFAQYFVNQLASELTTQEIADFSCRMYYMSRSSLSEFFRNTATASRKTELKDISLYRSPNADYGELMQEKERHAAIRPNKSEKAFHLAKMKELLTPAGYALYVDATSSGKEWVDTELPPIPFEPENIPFLTTAQVMAKQKIKTNTSAYYYLEQAGAIRVRFAGKVLWYIPKYIGNWLVPCSYKS